MLQWKTFRYCHTFVFVLDLFFRRDMMSVRNFNVFICIFYDPRMKSETYGVMWHNAPESKIQLVNCELSSYFSLERSSLLDIRAIDAYILLSYLFSLLLHTRLPFSLKRTCLRRFSLYSGGLGYFAIIWSSDLHLKHFRGRRSEFLLDETSTARAFSFSFLILLKHFSAV